MQRRTLLKGIAATSAWAGISPTLFASDKVDVIIIGAGLAGLNTAYQLHKSGYKVLVLEARDRVGGRILSLSDLPGHPEAGGQQIGTGYGFTRTLANEFNLEMESLGDFARNTKYVIDGQIITSKQWENHSLNGLSPEEKAIPPSRLYFHYLQKAPAFQFSSDWLKDDMATLDVPMRQLFKHLGASDQALALIDANLNANNLAELSAADGMYRLKLALNGSRGSHRVKGGNSGLTEAIARRISQHMQLKKHVIKISDSDGVTVHCLDGSRFHARKCVITTPFSTLRDVEFDASMGATKKRAIQQVNYTQISQVHFGVKPGVSKEDPLFSNLWSNHPFGRIFTSADKTGHIASMLSWINGDAAVALDKLSAKQAIRMVLQSLESSVPGLKGKITPLHYQSWGNDIFSKGAYVHFGPGQVQQFVKVMANIEGNLHFAGEHTEFDYAGMESALVSGLRAYQEITQTLG